MDVGREDSDQQRGQPPETEPGSPPVKKGRPAHHLGDAADQNRLLVHRQPFRHDLLIEAGPYEVKNAGSDENETEHGSEGFHAATIGIRRGLCGGAADAR